MSLLKLKQRLILEDNIPRKKNSQNKDYVMGFLKNKRIPSLPAGCTHHFFISKDEKFKKDSVIIAKWLVEMGFSVWESQLEKDQQRSLTPDAMQRGIKKAAVVILLLTPGVFHSNRHFVWKTEIKHALEVCHKPLMVIKIDGFRSEKCKRLFATKVEPHHIECCENTNDEFQPWCRAILRTPTRVPWKMGDVGKQRDIVIEFRKIHDRGYTEDPAFREEIERQRQLHSEKGSCLGSGSVNTVESKVQTFKTFNGTSDVGTKEITLRERSSM